MVKTGAYPPWLNLAIADIGTIEGAGSTNNPKVQRYYVDAGSGWQPDSVPWCAAGTGAWLKRSGWKPSGSLAARSYLAPWGVRVPPQPGAIVVFPRGNSKWQGHVAIVLSVDVPRGTMRVVGANQNDAVNVKTRRIKEALDFRWPTERLPAPKAKAYKLARGEATAMADMTPMQIMAEAQKLYGEVDSTFSIRAGRAAAKRVCSLLYYLAKMHIPAVDAKALPKGLPKPKPKRKRK